MKILWRSRRISFTFVSSLIYSCKAQVTALRGRVSAYIEARPDDISAHLTNLAAHISLVHLDRLISSPFKFCGQRIRDGERRILSTNPIAHIVPVTIHERDTNFLIKKRT